jgi:hypothetical protein
MRRRFALLAFGVGLLGAGVAESGTLVYAQLTVVIGTLPPGQFTASGPLGGGATGTLGTAIWSVGEDAVPGGTAVLPIPTSAAPPISQIQMIINGNPGAGAFAASMPGQMAVTGVTNVKAFGGLTLLGVPVVLGQSTTITQVGSGVAVTAYAHEWTTKTTTIQLLSPAGPFGSITQVTQMGANGLVNGAGAVVLVSALNVVTGIAGQLPSFGFLVLQYVPGAPEPGALALLGSGVAGLVALGRRKLRR